FCWGRAQPRTSDRLNPSSINSIKLAGFAIRRRGQGPAENVEGEVGIGGANWTPPITQQSLQKAADDIRYRECRQFRVDRADFSGSGGGREHLREMCFAFLRQVGELGGKWLSFHAHASEFGHVDAKKILMRFE